MKRLSAGLSAILLILSLSACSPDSNNEQSDSGNEPSSQSGESSHTQTEQPIAFSGKIIPETFSITMDEAGGLVASQPGDSKTVAELTSGDGTMSWRYPEEAVAVELTQQVDYLDVLIRYEGPSDTEASFAWPTVSGDDYTLPIGEGKRFSADDPVWTDYLGGQTWEIIESFSMSFAAAGKGDKALVYIFPENFNNEIVFTEGGALGFTVRHTWPSINQDKTYRVRVYVTENDPVSIAKVYKSYAEEIAGIKTLEEKAANNPNIEKLYGAPHIYLFDSTVISEEDVHWEVFRENLDTAPMEWIRSFAADKLEDSAGFLSVLEEIRGQDYVGAYQKQVITQGLSQMLMLPGFFNMEVFTQSDDRMASLLVLSRNFTRTEEIQLNKYALDVNLSGVFQPVETWADSRTVNLLRDMKDSGIEQAWIGLNDWEQAFSKPELVDTTVGNGWLIGPYDSYHSVHEPGKEEWATAAFPAEVYNDYAIQNKDGSYVGGFQAVGRKSNPTLSLPYVRERVSGILQNGAAFNSWFVDCDATGEIYDDYTPAHLTTKRQDYDARLERMAAIALEYGMVVGSEGGNDYAANTIAFAHGIELQTFSWMDEDMKANKESEYYLGRWYAANGGVPEKFSKQVPVKEKYRELFLNPAYTVPLYKLVYNNAVITGYHWDWSTLKIAGEVENRMLYEMLYNVPPMFHLDKFQWEEHGGLIAEHVKTWSDWSRQVIHKEMTGFEVLSDDRLVQLARYGDKWILANWSGQSFSYEGKTAEPGGFLIG